MRIKKKTLLTIAIDEKLKQILSELRHSFTGHYGDRLIQLILYGSQARGDVTSTSDIDILVILKGTVDPGDEIAQVGEITSTLSLKYNVVISCVFLSAERYATEQSPLLLNVRREGVTI